LEKKTWFFRIFFSGTKKWALFALFWAFSAIFRYLKENLWFFVTLIPKWYQQTKNLSHIWKRLDKNSGRN
jgi:hypothetical protein